MKCMVGALECNGELNAVSMAVARAVLITTIVTFMSPPELIYVHGNFSPPMLKLLYMIRC